MSYHQSIGEALFGEECDTELRRAQDFVYGLDQAERAMARTGVPASLFIKVTQPAVTDDEWARILGDGRH